MIENGTHLFSNKFLDHGNDLSDLVYVIALNFYLLGTDSMLFRKDIGNKPPYPFMKEKCAGNRAVAGLRYSKLHQRIIINKEWKNISVLNPKTRKIEIEITKSVGNEIREFKLFGKNENRVVSITEDGHILLYSLG